jgi:hypothetical protein
MSEFKDTPKQAAEQMSKAYDADFCFRFAKQMSRSQFHNETAHAYWAEVVRELHLIEASSGA